MIPVDFTLVALYSTILLFGNTQLGRPPEAKMERHVSKFRGGLQLVLYGQ